MFRTITGVKRTVKSSSEVIELVIAENIRVQCSVADFSRILSLQKQSTDMKKVFSFCSFDSYKGSFCGSVQVVLE